MAAALWWMVAASVPLYSTDLGTRSHVVSAKEQRKVDIMKKFMDAKLLGMLFLSVKLAFYASRNPGDLFTVEFLTDKILNIPLHIQNLMKRQNVAITKCYTIH
jgi:hypothetical protein